jgi:CDP-glucose 4,6-dehydratase
MALNSTFWSGRRVFITGHTGFKGGWLALWLRELGAQVYGYALPPPATPSLWQVAQLAEVIPGQLADIRDAQALSDAVVNFRPEIILHLAAQPLVRESYRAPAETYAVNVMGTVNLLEAARQCDSLRAVVVVTTDKCYENREWLWPYREQDVLGGLDPYSNSKACIELLCSSYRASFLHSRGVALATARAGNVLGRAADPRHSARLASRRIADPALSAGDPALAARARALIRLPVAGSGTGRTRRYCGVGLEFWSGYPRYRQCW